GARGRRRRGGRGPRRFRAAAGAGAGPGVLVRGDGGPRRRAFAARASRGARQPPPRLPGDAGSGARARAPGGLGQPRPHGVRVRPHGPHLGLRRGAAERRAHPDRARGDGALRAPPLRRQAGADLRRAPRQLGAAGHRRGAARAGCGGAVPPSQQPLRRPRHPGAARGQHGRADPGRLVGADPHDGGAGPRSARRDAGGPALRARPARGVPRAAGGEQPAAGAARPPLRRLPGPWRTRDPVAEWAVPFGDNGGDRPPAQRDGSRGRRGGDGAGEPDRRGLGAGASRPMAVDAPALAV
ncbi:MAG: Lipid A biosynthesis lauroyl acyltransferase, partial [uncultured Acetobacteraceae bacterium]